MLAKYFRTCLRPKTLLRLSNRNNGVPFNTTNLKTPEYFQMYTNMYKESRNIGSRNVMEEILIARFENEQLREEKKKEDLLTKESHSETVLAPSAPHKKRKNRQLSSKILQYGKMIVLKRKN